MTFEFEAIGTHWKIDIEGGFSQERGVVLLQKIKDRITEFDKVYSRFREDSLVTKMSKEKGEFVLPSDADKMLSLYKKIYDLTTGQVTPLIGQTLVDAGYDANYSLKEKPLTHPKQWQEVMSWENPKLKLFEPTLLDFGAGGKGYLVDLVSELIEGEGLKVYCIDAGGDMRHRGSVGFKVGLENPENFEEVIGVVELFNQSLCGSAGNRRRWGNFHHIINPQTLKSPRNILAVWCIASNTLTADLLTTALFFTSPHELLKNFIFEYFILYPDFTMEKSPGFPAEVFTAK